MASAASAALIAILVAMAGSAVDPTLLTTRELEAEIMMLPVSVMDR
jgi:hypothetical protein